MTTAELANYIAPFLAPARRIAEIANTKPESFTYKNHRTYYLGANGRVSQRKQLVGEIIATVRACTTDHARFLFTEKQAEDLNAMRLCLAPNTPMTRIPKPYIGHSRNWCSYCLSFVDEPVVLDGVQACPSCFHRGVVR